MKVVLRVATAIIGRSHSPVRDDAATNAGGHRDATFILDTLAARPLASEGRLGCAKLHLPGLLRIPEEGSANAFAHGAERGVGVVAAGATSCHVALLDRTEPSGGFLR